MQRKPALHLLWALPLAVLLSLPSVAIAGISWCGISGCSSGGWGIDTDYVHLAVAACIGAAIVMAVNFSCEYLVHSFDVFRAGTFIEF